MTKPGTRVTDTILGDDLRWSLLAVGLGVLLSVLLWLGLTAYQAMDPRRYSPVPIWDLGVVLFGVLPILVGYVFLRNRGTLPTFLLSFLPVYTMYEYQYHHIPAFVHPSPIESALLHFSVYYWLLGIAGAALLTGRLAAPERTPSESQPKQGLLERNIRTTDSPSRLVGIAVFGILVFVVSTLHPGSITMGGLLTDLFTIIFLPVLLGALLVWIDLRTRPSGVGGE